MLNVSSLNKHFGGIHAVRDLSFSAERNNITAIIGPNGAGKTTVFNLLTGIYKPDVGSIYFHDKKISGKKIHEISTMGITRTFQNLQIFSNMTVQENVMTGMHLKCKSGLIKSMLSLNRNEEKVLKEKSMEYIKMLGLEKYSSLPSASLPIGILRQVEITRALASDPELLLMDEPAAGLNPYETDELAEKIVAIKDSGVTVLLIEHDMNLVMRISNHVIVLNFGEKIAEGRPEDIQKNPEVIKAYLGE